MSLMPRHIYQDPPLSPHLSHYNFRELMMLFKLSESSVLSLLSSGNLKSPTSGAKGRQSRKLFVSLEEVNGFLQGCFVAPPGLDFEPMRSWEDLVETTTIQHTIESSRRELDLLQQKKLIPYYRITRKVIRYRERDFARWAITVMAQI